MKKKLFLMMLLGWMGTAAFAQDGAKKLLSNPVLQEISVLKDLAYQITTAENELATTSRSNAANAQQKLNTLYASYAKELENQKTTHAKDAKVVEAINEELKLVNSKK